MSPAGTGVPLIDVVTGQVHRSSGLAKLTACGLQLDEANVGQMRDLLAGLSVCEACWGLQGGLWPVGD